MPPPPDQHDDVRTLSRNSVDRRSSYEQASAVDYSVWIHASPEEVWRVYVDPSRIPEWQTGSPVIEEVRGSGDKPGSTYVSRRRPGAARTTVIDVDKPGRLMTSTEAYLGLRFDVTSSLTPQADGTLLELRAQTHWPRGLGLLGKLVEAVILSPREAQKELGRLKQLIESNPPNLDLGTLPPASP